MERRHLPSIGLMTRCKIHSVSNLLLKLTISSLGLTNSRACRLMAWNAALGAYPGWYGVEGVDVETSVLPVTVNCFLLIDIVCKTERIANIKFAVNTLSEMIYKDGQRFA